MRTFRISNRISGQVLGDWQGVDADDAIEAMARDAGYTSQAEIAILLGVSVAALRGELSVLEIFGVTS